MKKNKIIKKFKNDFKKMDTSSNLLHFLLNTVFILFIVACFIKGTDLIENKNNFQKNLNDIKEFTTKDKEESLKSNTKIFNVSTIVDYNILFTNSSYIFSLKEYGIQKNCFLTANSNYNSENRSVFFELEEVICDDYNKKVIGFIYAENATPFILVDEYFLITKDRNFTAFITENKVIQNNKNYIDDKFYEEKIKDFEKIINNIQASEENMNNVK